MILYYSGIRGDLCSPSVVLGDKANVMLSFWECGKADGTPAAGFIRLERERKDKKRKPFVAYRDYQSDRLDETKYIVLDVFGKVLAGPTPLLTSLVLDYKPKSNLEFIHRLPKGLEISPSGKIPVAKFKAALYVASDGKWEAIKTQSTKKRSK